MPLLSDLPLEDDDYVDLTYNYIGLGSKQVCDHAPGWMMLVYRVADGLRITLVNGVEILP